MNTANLRSRLGSFLISHNTKFTKDVKIPSGLVDYVIETDGQLHGVVVRGSRANTHTTIGHLVNVKRTFSHVYLLAPPNLVEKVDRALREAATLPSVGFLTFSTEDLVYLKKTQPKNYYFNKPTELKTKKVFRSKHIILNEIDKQIINRFRGVPVTIAEISKELGVSMPNAYRRVLRLKKAKLLVEISPESHYPKVYKIPENTEIKEIISLDV